MLAAIFSVLARICRVGHIPGAGRIRIPVYMKMDASGQCIGLQPETEDARIVGLNFVPCGKIFDPEPEGSARINYKLDLLRREIFDSDIKSAAAPVQPSVLFVIGPGYYHIASKFLAEAVLKRGKPLLKRLDRKLTRFAYKLSDPDLG